MSYIDELLKAHPEHKELLLKILKINKLTPAQACAVFFGDDGVRKDLLISAGAGSGKTFTLTKRLVKRVIVDRDDISKKLIVTFTREASNELKVRIADGISDAISKLGELEIDKSEKASLKEHLEGQIISLGATQISTIDAFCLKIVRESFASLGLEAGFRVSDESENEMLCNDSISEVLDEFFEGKHLGGRDSDEYRDFLSLADTLSTFSGDTNLRKALLGLYQKLSSTRDGLETLLSVDKIDENGDFMKTPYGMALREALICGLRHFIGFCDYGLRLCDYSEDCSAYLRGIFEDDKRILTELLDIATHTSYPVYPKIKEMLSAIKFKQGQRGYKEIVISTPEGDDITGAWLCADPSPRQDLKDFIKKMKTEYFCLSDDALRQEILKTRRVCRSLYTVLKCFDKRYSEKKRQLGVCDFNDISRFALSLLYNDDGTPSALANEISERYDEVYVDEYQDTNFVQDAVFSAIARGKRFLVGDIKQSIYRFRSAEPEIFSDYRRKFSSIEFDSENKPILDTSSDIIGYSLFMNENFRCDKSVIDFANTVSDFMFTASLPTEDEARFCMSQSIAYEKRDSLVFAKNEAGVPPHDAEVLLIDRNAQGDDNSDDDDDESDTAEGEGDGEEKDLKGHYIEAETVASKISELLANGYLANGQKITADKIAILLYSFDTPAEFYINALRRRGIPCEYKGKEHFFEKSEVLLALDILHAINNPLRDTYLAGAMLSSIFGFELAELVRIKTYSRDSVSLFEAIEKYDNDDKLCEKARIFLKRLNDYRERARKMTSYEVISMILADTSLLLNINESERASLYKLYELARGFERGKYKGLYSFLRHIEGFSAKENKVRLGSIDVPSVKVMTVHASKGLEYEVCFVCSCGSDLKCKDSGDSVLYHRDLGVSSYIYRDGGVVKFESLLRRCSTLAIKKAYYEEQMRLLYVAMTRARSKLYITAILPRKSKLSCKERLDGMKRLSQLASRYSVLHTRSFIELVTHALCKSGKGDTVQIIPPRLDVNQGKNTTDNDLAREREARRLRLEEKALDALKSEIQHRFDFEYPYDYLSKLPAKLSISELKPLLLDKNDKKKDTDKDRAQNTALDTGLGENSGEARDNSAQISDDFSGFSDTSSDKEENSALGKDDYEKSILSSLSKDERDIFSSVKYSIATLPDFAIEGKDKTEFSPAERGTATHMFMQFCRLDLLKENGVDAELKRLCDNDNRYISDTVASLVNKEQIEKFVSDPNGTGLFEELLDAEQRGEIWREFRFNVFLPASEFTEEPKLQNEKILVQGVTDCIYKDKDGNLVLIDYKTDSVTEENYIGKLVNRYKYQLMYYKEAVNIIFGKYPDKTLLYCVPLAKTVPVYAKLKK